MLRYTRDINATVEEVIGTVGFLVAAIALLLCIAGAVIVIIGRCKLFKKCGVEAWKAIIPFYGDYVFFTNICGLHWAWFVAYLVIAYIGLQSNTVSLLRIFVNAMAFYNLGIRCGKDSTASMIFGGLFSEVVAAIYGFSDLHYDSSIPVKNCGLF